MLSTPDLDRGLHFKIRQDQRGAASPKSRDPFLRKTSQYKLYDLVQEAAEFTWKAIIYTVVWGGKADSVDHQGYYRHYDSCHGVHSHFVHLHRHRTEKKEKPKWDKVSWTTH